MSTCPPADRPRRRNRDSADECPRSAPSSASGSRKTVTASSNETPCFAALASAFRGSHLEHVFSIYEMRDWLDALRLYAYRFTPCRPPYFRAVSASELCHIPPGTPGNHLQLRGNLDAYRCWVKSLIGSALVDLVCVSTRGGSRFPSVLLQPLGHLSALESTRSRAVSD